MDHLKTAEERRNRWYARHLIPKVVPVVPAPRWEDLWNCCEDGGDYDKEERESSDGGSPYSEVKAVPFSWLSTSTSSSSSHDRIEQEGQHSNPDGDSGMFSLSLKEKLRKVLDCHGFLVVTGVLNESDCEKAIELAWDWIEAASAAEETISSKPSSSSSSSGSNIDNIHASRRAPVHRHDLSTLASPFFPSSLEGGMMPFYGSGHSTFAWAIRSHPGVKRVFEVIHGEEKENETIDLVSSLDGIVLWHNKKLPKDAGWFHLDQNPRFKPNMECIQGLVNLLPVDSGTGGNALVARSHKYFPQHYLDDEGDYASSCSKFYSQRLDELGDEDWMEIDPHDDNLLDPSRIITCMLGAGDMLLWDSRTVHCSYPPVVASHDHSSTVVPRGAAPGNIGSNGYGSSGLIRAATLVSMMPSKRIPIDVLAARKVAVQEGRTLTHWTNKVAPLGAENQQHAQLEKSRVSCIRNRQKQHGNATVLLDYDALTLEQSELVLPKKRNKDKP